MSFSGPLPPPEVLIAYDEAVPGAAKKIIAMADRQAKHRQSLETAVINSDIRQSRWGLWAGLGVSLTAILFGSVLIYFGHDVAGATVAGLPTASLVGVFVHGTRSRRQELAEKAEKVKKKK